MTPVRVIMLPGSVLPASLAYGALIAALGPGVDVIAKELELYRDDSPPPGWGLDSEIEGVLREADARGWETFHLLGYSGGGAAALAFTAKHPERLLSLTLLEAAWAGNWGWSEAHTLLWKQYQALESLPPDQFMAAFMRLGVRPGVQLAPPPPGDPPPWMAKRPAGVAAFLHEFGAYDLDRTALAAFERPVLFVLGGKSNPDDYGEIARRLSDVFSEYRLVVFDDRHHFDPPHRIEPGRLAALLHEHWRSI